MKIGRDFRGFDLVIWLLGILIAQWLLPSFSWAVSCTPGLSSIIGTEIVADRCASNAPAYDYTATDIWCQNGVVSAIPYYGPTTYPDVTPDSMGGYLSLEASYYGYRLFRNTAGTQFVLVDRYFAMGGSIDGVSLAGYAGAPAVYYDVFDQPLLPSEILASCSDSVPPKITSFTGTSGTLDPITGGNITFTGDISDSSGSPVSWTLTVDGRTYTGSGTTVKVTWDGKDGNDKVVPGTYTATLSAQADDGQNATPKSLKVTVSPPQKDCMDYVTVGSKANVASGELVNSLDLFSTSGNGPSLGMSLYYSSLDAFDGSLGTGWSDSFDIFVTKDQSGDVVLHQGNGVRRLYALSGSSYTSQPGDTSVLTKNAASTFLLTREDGTRFAFNADGKIATITDRNGNALTFTYARGLLQNVTDGAGRSVTFSYDASGKLATVTDPTGAIYSFSVGESLSSVVLPGGGTWSYTYDAGSFLSSKTDPNGNTTTYAYDAEHRLISATDPSGNTRSLSYPAAGATNATTQFTEQDGGVWQYSYDTTSGNLLAKTDPQGNVTSYTYDANHDLLTKTDPSGTTTYAYDTEGDPTSVTDPLGQTTRSTYNTFGEVTSVTDPSNHVTSYAYDANGNLTSVTDPTGAVTKVTYDAKGRVTSVTDPTGGTTTIAYDASGNPTRVTGPTGVVTTSTYDAAGRVLSQTDANGQTTTYAYEAQGHLAQTTDPLGHTTTFTYDANGNKVSQTDADGNTTTFAYDSLGHVVKMTDANGAPTSFGYGESAGCPSCGGGGGSTLSSLTDANGHATTFQYDTNGRLTKEIDPLGRATLYSYDAEGHLASKTDPDGQTLSYSYDALGRLVKKSDPDGTSATFSYDAQGNLLTAANSNASYTFTYDAAGHVTSVTDGSGNKVSYAFDAAGRRILLEAPGGKDLLYRYDAAGRLSAIVLDSGTFDFTYDTLGRRSTLTYPNGVVADYGYDKNSDLTSLQYRTHRGEPFASFSYSLDAVGNRLSTTSGTRTTTYGYDKIYQLLKAATRTRGFISAHDKDRGHGNADHAQKALETHKAFYQYDPVGNRQKSTWVKSYTHDAGNELLSAGRTSYQYDNDGNLIEKDTPAGAVLYSWNAENQLTQVTLPNGSTVSFKYDPFGRRIEKKVIGRNKVETLRYLYDGANILFTTSDGDDGGASHHGHHDKHYRNTHPAPLQGTLYIQGPGVDEHLTFIRGGKTFYYHADGLGSVIALTDEHGNVVQKYAYDGFGNFENPGLDLGGREHPQVDLYNWFTDGRSLFGDRNHQISYNDERAPAAAGNAKDAFSQPYGFTGREYDSETGLYYYRARYYDPTAGRFISEDPIGFAGGDVNLYRYVQNNPVMFIDPYGLALSDILPAIGTAMSQGAQAGAYAIGQAGHAIFDLATNGPPAARAALGFAGLTVAVPLTGAAAISALPAVYQLAPYSEAIVDFTSSALPGTAPTPSLAGAAGVATNYLYGKLTNSSSPCGK